MKDVFSGYHPVTNLLYFLLVIGSAMLLRDPVFIMISLIGGFSYSVYLGGSRRLSLLLRIIIPVSLLIIIINPLVNHQGLTIIKYFKNGNPFTLESIVYGAISAGMVAGVIALCTCWNDIMTSDKVIYLIGSGLPNLGLVISMTLRLIPHYRRQAKMVRDAQQGITLKSKSSLKRKIIGSVRVFSSMLTWSLEHGAELAYNMRRRGYGRGKRSQYSLYRFRKSDFIVLVLMIFLGSMIIVPAIGGHLFFTCFPTFIYAPFGVGKLMAYIAYIVLIMIPMLLDALTLRTNNIQGGR